MRACQQDRTIHRSLRLTAVGTDVSLSSTSFKVSESTATPLKMAERAVSIRVRRRWSSERAREMRCLRSDGMPKFRNLSIGMRQRGQEQPFPLVNVLMLAIMILCTVVSAHAHMTEASLTSPGSQLNT